jgi:photosystem II stability/assembly factor-like uncharacterized protein
VNLYSLSRGLMQLASVLLALLFALPAASPAQWIPLGPEGGDVRSLTYDPHDPRRIFLGTSASQLFVSTDNGSTWSRLARLGEGEDYVLDAMEVDPRSGTLYVAAWSANLETAGGDLFRSRDGGRTWQALPGMRQKSIRALLLAPSDANVIVVGARDGVFRSRDGGDNWERISPSHDAQIKNVESVAMDPRNPDVIYAGTWHLAWKTVNGGRVWRPMKNGVIDDSDVFSIIIDSRNSSNVYLSACSGIYKSENAGEAFHKVQGIPFSARRTRVLKQDPLNAMVVYAGTTEGLWRTTDAGKSWRRIVTSIIVNDVHVDPHDSGHILLATDRGGVLASTEGGKMFVASNRGFSHRMVGSILVDRSDVHTFYAGLLNDKEFGGVFVSHDDGRSWHQSSRGIHKLDVFALAQAKNGDLVAGTNKGMFKLPRGASEWQIINTIVQAAETGAPAGDAPLRLRRMAAPAREPRRSEPSTRVWHIEISGRKWFAATESGLYESLDEGKTWQGGALLGYQDFRTVCVSGSTVLAVTAKAALVSKDGGETWKLAQLPPFVSLVHGGTATPNGVLWLATQEGAIRSTNGASWEHMLGALSTRPLETITYDYNSRKLLAASNDGQVFTSVDGGQSWQVQGTGYSIHALAMAGGRILAASAFSGVVIQPATEQHPVPRK